MLKLKYDEYQPVNDLYLLETETPKRPKEDFDTSSTGIIVQRKSIIESRATMGKIVKKGPKTDEDYKIDDIINFYPEAGLDIVFEDKENKYVLMGDEKFLAKIIKV